MSVGQIAALILAVLLFFPGGCFLYVGFGLLSDKSAMQMTNAAVQMLLVGGVIMAAVVLLGWLALRRRRRPASRPGGAP